MLGGAGAVPRSGGTEVDTLSWRCLPPGRCLQGGAGKRHLLHTNHMSDSESGGPQCSMSPQPCPLPFSLMPRYELGDGPEPKGGEGEGLRTLIYVAICSMHWDSRVV